MTELEQKVLALNNSQVYFKKAICDCDFKALTKANTVYYVDTAKLEQVNNGVYFLQIYGSDVTLNLYEYLTYDEMLDFVSKQFIPLEYLVKAYHIFNQSAK